MQKNQLEMDILALYDNNLVNVFSINQIAKLLGKTYPYINKKVTELLNDGVLKKIIVGKAYLCTLNFECEKTLLLLSMLELNKRKKHTEVGEFIQKNMLNFTVHTVVKYNRKLLFVVENLHDRRKIGRAFENSIVVDKREFLDMLFDEEKLFKNHTVLYGAEKFYQLLRIEINELKRLHSPLRY